MSYVDTVKDAHLDQLRDAAESLRRLRAECPPVIRQAVRFYLDTFGPFPGKDALAQQIAQPIVALVQEQCDYLLDVVAHLEELVSWMGSPEALRAAADALQVDVSDAAATLAGDLDASTLSRLDSWRDLPAAKYMVVRDRQRDELLRVPPFVDALKSVLRGMADAVEQYYLAVVQTVGGVVVAVAGVVTAVAAAATGVGIPVAVIGLVGAVVGAMVALAGIVQLVTTTSQTQGNLLETARTSFTTPWATGVSW